MILSLAALSGDVGLANVGFRRAFMETSQVPLLHGRAVIKNKRTRFKEEKVIPHPASLDLTHWREFVG